jgi:hypothetical protein
VAPAIQGALDELGGVGDSADELDDEIHLRIVDDAAGISGEQVPFDRFRALFVWIANRNCAKLVTSAAAAFDCIALALEPIGHVGADGPTPEQSDPDGQFHNSQPPVAMGKRGKQCAPRRVRRGAREAFVV